MQKKNSTFQKKKRIFGHFRVLAKITKMAKKPFFILKSGNFFSHTLIIWEDQHFSCNTLLDSVKKSKQKWEKAEKMACAKKCLFSIFAHFFWPNQKCKNWKILVSPTEFCVSKKFPLFKRKNGFLAIFVFWPKSQKWPKTFFNFKSENFFHTP